MGRQVGGLCAAFLLLLAFVSGVQGYSDPLLPAENACFPRCRNGGTCFTQGYGIGTCFCSPSYTGTLCETQVAPPVTTEAPDSTISYRPKLGNSRCRFDLDCLNGGTCTDGYCHCNYPYSGVNCQDRDGGYPGLYRQCPGACSYNGHCDSTTGRCDCRPGWAADDCSEQSGTCTHNLAHGSIHCQCIDGYTGIKCQQRVTCPRLSTSLRSGSVSVSVDQSSGSVPYETTATYTCRSGFTLSGDSTRRCQATGTWSGAMPSCSPYLPPVTRPAYRPCARACENYGSCDTTVGRCQCQPGYVGQYCTKQTGDQCRYDYLINKFVCSCKPGYGGNTCTEPVTCPRISTSLPYGTVTLSSSQSLGYVAYGIMATYSCNTGYRLQGEGTRVCQQNGTWSGTAPRCTRDSACPQGCNAGQCDEATGKCKCQPLTGGPDCSMETGSCTFQSFRVVCNCILGFKGTYCAEPVTCPPIPTSLSNGNVKVNASQTSGYAPYGTTATYTCNTGYRLEGESSQTCQQNGAWNGTAPQCLMHIPCTQGCRHGQCNPATGKCNCPAFYAGADCSIQTGSCSVQHFRRVCHCNPGYTGSSCSEPVTCPRLSISFRYGSVTVSASQTPGYVAYGIIARYTCNAGYTLHGNGTRQCQNNGTWSGNLPQCYPKPAPTQTPYQPCSTGCAPGTCIRATRNCRCSPGYFGPSCDVQSGVCFPIQGGRIWCSCQAGYTGSHCESRVTCPAIPSILQYGQVTFSQQPSNGMYPFSTSAKYECSQGYVLRGDQHRYCMRSGAWNGTSPTCAPLPHSPKKPTCSALPPPANGKMTQQLFKLTTLLIFSCNYGYRLSGSTARICLPSGQWTGNDTTCSAVTCPVPQDIAAGRRSSSMNTAGSKVSYACFPGYTLVGNKHIRCLSDGQWSGSPPTCQKPHAQQCCVLDAVPFATMIGGQGARHIGAQVTYTCLPGYVLRSGNAFRLCQANGAWSGTPPRCERVMCPDPGVVANSQRTISDPLFPVGSTVTYTCNPGYGLAGADQLRCGSAGRWLAPVPVCETKAICDGRFADGQTVYLSPTSNQPLAADILVVAEETLGLVQEHTWLRQAILDIEANLTSMGIGTDPALRNQYSLVGFGRSASSGKSCVNRLVPALDGVTTFTADLFQVATARLVPDAATASSSDAYSAIVFGLENAALRYGPNIAHNLILMTSSGRKAPCPPAVERGALMQALQESGFLVNFLVNHPLVAGFDKEEDVFAVRVNPDTNTLSAVLRNKKAHLRKVSNAFINFTSTDGTVNQDYTQPALAIGGVVWNINMLKTGSVNILDSFSFAFRTVKASEIFLQTKSCKVCTCLTSGNLRCRLVSDQEMCLDRCTAQRPPVIASRDCGPMPPNPIGCAGDICRF